MDQTSKYFISSSRLPVSKGIRENNYKGVFIPGLVYIPIRSVSEALTYYRKGKKRRKVAETLLNTQSSRSHCVFTLYLVRIENIDGDTKSARLNQLSLCDLAGSERMGRTHNEGDRQKESSSINSSLMTLRNCIEILRDNQKSRSACRVVPYRESRLTLMFRNFFEGDGRIRMIICLNAIPGDFEENLHVVRFAEITQEVKVKTETRPK
ncbi:Kinesin-like protein KIF23 [Thelohanellus kitauei]|uniref:Kinesin-like protein KIF23 n=1 Tax=Thelohanellus kitauei TaxID=669202 RepID=A0A0C2NJ76_THEKT|nr:Kinesin-like protein KIF23 [Thelohanellus kitauei]